MGAHIHWRIFLQVVVMALLTMAKSNAQEGFLVSLDVEEGVGESGLGEADLSGAGEVRAYLEKGDGLSTGHKGLQVMEEDGGEGRREGNGKAFLEIRVTHHISRRNRTTGVGLFPVVFNLATRAKITANATCGETAPETYCKLVEHVLRRPTRRIQCGTCDAYSADIRETHPIENAIDGSQRWWQSPSISNGVQYNWVTVTLDLGQVFQVAYVIMKAANSPRPGNWLLERSVDGVNYRTWQVYALSDSDCWNMYGMKPTVGVPRLTTDDQVVCSSFYSRLDPLENGEIHTSLVNGRPGVDGPSDMLRDFTSARYIRLQFQRIRTLNADLMTFMSNDPRDLDPSVTNRYFYSIKDISVGGQCICYGHASQCPIDPHTGEMRCECEKNTCGKSCETCCPLYNQFLWKQGTYSEGGGCEACMCYNHAASCVYNQTVANLRLSLNTYGDYEGGGVCMDCQHNTMGINCELCADGYYRPSGVDPTSPDACVPCDCDTHGATGHCVKDDSRILEGTCAGDCQCNEGFAGPKCSSCALGWVGYPACEQCPCSQAGSLNIDACEGDCVCKPNVCGPFCDECSPGHFDLQESSPDGCLQCFCFELSSECHSLHWGTAQLTIMEGWNITDEAGVSVPSAPDLAGHLVVEGSTVAHLDRVRYWSAPWQYTGNKMLTYGGRLEYRFGYWLNTSASPDDLNNNYLGNHDVIIEGSGMRLGHNGRYFREHQDNIVTVNMTEGEWRHMEGSASSSGGVVLREELLMALAQVDRLLIRATHHAMQTEARLKLVRLDEASPEGAGPVMSAIELCECPEGYAGTSCEQCAEGYRRVDNQLLGGLCQPCQCNGHATRCDPFTGHCLECSENTAGPNCDRCAPGYYGDALRGDCRRCRCPLEAVESNFAEGCGTDPNTPGVEFVCYGCEPGYEGDYCERCSEGFYGNPLLPGNNCKPCDCHGNVDATAGGRCDRETGECLVCLHHTEGAHCGKCMLGYYGTAFNGDCSLCGCDVHGSTSDVCDQETGLCRCRDGYRGRDCGRCLPGHGNAAAGCPLCNCDVTGSLSTSCDDVTGQCTCRLGVGGLRCDVCRPGFYSFSAIGCYSCECDSYGTSGTGCDSVSGQCTCRPHTEGRHCNRCSDGYWGLLTEDGCQSCDCDVTGSVLTSCDVINGQCTCLPGVGGRRCEECMVGYYGFSVTGCKLCSVCAAPGQVCDRMTGECVCPPRTEGTLCERCAPDSWGHDPYLGCKPCACNSTGAVDGHCDVMTGQCTCQDGFAGPRCDRCQFGHYGFPHCVPCYCDPAGTQLSACDTNGQCQCDEQGVCPCKENVVNNKCRFCRRGSFSLEEQNPAGCTACYCFGRSNTCSQGDFIWSKLQFSRREVLMEAVPGAAPSVSPDARGLMVLLPGVSRVYVDPYHRPLTVYWALPDTALGDKTLSYNGRLRFTAEYDLGDKKVAAPSTFPLVQLIGAFRLHLQYVLESAPSDRGYYEVLLREDLWQDADGQPVNREQFMVALQNVQKLLIFAAPHSHVTDMRLESVSLDLAIPSDGSPNIATGVEKCVCPSEYEGASCQNPGTGYYRQRPADFIHSKDVVDLVGDSERCHCHRHALLCEPETGKCLDCVHSTVGDHCERCTPGHYGNSTQGTAYDCKKCACPLFAPDNNFSPTCYAVGYGDYMCDACRPGYTGVHCERCAEGYYGNPEVVGGRCVPCACNGEGTLTPDLCDPHSGACSCLPGIWGHACDKCTDRYALINGVCTSCDTGCPGMLMTFVDELEHMVTNYNETSLALWPYKYLAAFGKEVEKLQEKLDRSNVHGIKTAMMEVDELQQMVRGLKDKHHVVKRGDQKEVEARELRKTAEDLADNIKKTHHQHTVEIGKLRAATKSQIQNEAVNTRHLVDDAELLLAKIKAGFRGEEGSDPQVTADQELGRSQKSLDRMRELAKRQTNVTMVEVKLDDTNSKLRDMRAQTVKASNSSVHTEKLNQKNKLRLSDINMVNNELGERVADVRATTQEADKLKEDASFLVYNKSRANYQYLACVGSESVRLEEYEAVYNNKACAAARQGLKDPMDDVEEKAGLLEQNLPEAKAQLQDALNHAEQLDQQANELEAQFAVTRESAADPLKAAKVYKDIKEAVEEAETAAQDASVTADDVIIKTDMAEGGPLPGQALEARKASRGMATNASRLNPAPLEERLNISKKEMKATKQNQDRIVKEWEHIKHELNNFTTGVNRAVRVLAYRAEKTGERAADVLERVQEKHKIIETQMWPKVKQLEELLEGGPLSRANATLQVARDSMRQVLNMTEMLSEQLTLLEDVNTNITDSIRQLRDNIQLAREQANNIKVSIQSEGECVRRYVPPIEPSNRNNIVLHFKTDHVEEPMMLLYVGKEDQTDFMAVELVERHVQFSWDMGGGARTIVHPLLVEPAAGKHKEEDMWYKVTVERLQATVKLSVYLLSSNTLEDPDRVEDVAASSFTQLNLADTADLFIGGVSAGYELPTELTSRKFRGCLGGVHLDGKHVGLYNFRYLEKEGSCSGCASVPSEDYADVGFQFDGTGFAETPPVRGFKPDLFTAALSFKTFWEEGQLFFASNDETGDFASLELQGGRVVFRYSMGDGGDQRRRRRAPEVTWHTVSTENKYNTNEWVTALATFSRKEGVVLLKVDDEKVYADIPLNSDQGIQLAASSYYYGGVKPDVDLSMYGIQTTKFLGCIRDARVASRGSYRQNLLSEKYVGVEDGCNSQVARTTGFHGDGYTEHAAPDLSEKSDASFSFRTQQEEALLLLLRAVSDNFMSFSLTGGRFAAWFNVGTGLITLESSTTYNDGFFHAVSIMREQNIVVVYVDDEMVGELHLPAGSGGLKARSNGGLYLGGLPPGVDLGQMAASTERLRGCLSSLIMNQKVISLDEPIDYDRADVGRCDESVLFPGLHVTEAVTVTVIPSFTVTVTLPDSPGPTPAALTTADTPDIYTTAPDPVIITPYTPPKSCGVQGEAKYYSEAVAFGDIINSHAEIVVKRREVNRDFNISMDFKTYYNSSLLLYVTNEEQTEFIAVQLAEGTVLVSYHDRDLTRRIRSARRISDGVWHKLRLTKNRKSITLKVDDDPGINGRITRRVDVIAPLYVGGIPKVYKLRDDLIAESFKGCMREFYLNGRIVDLINSKAIMGVRPCFMDVEEGVHFDGWGHAVYSNEFEVRSAFKISFDFRTTNWNGVLFSISDPNTNPALALELVNGQLYMRAVNSHSSYKVSSEECRYCLCDNRWHHVDAAYLRGVVFLRIDGGILHTTGSTGGEERLDTYHQLFIGGFPVYANPQGATTTGEFFNGCMKNLHINDARAHWHNMYQLQAVHISACPLPNP